MILVDAGPQLALINADDERHQACAGVMKKLRPPLITVWPALTEAMDLLEDFQAQDALWQMVLRGVLGIESLTAADMTRMRDLMAIPGLADGPRGHRPCGGCGAPAGPHRVRAGQGTSGSTDRRDPELRDSPLSPGRPALPRATPAQPRL